MCLSMAVGANGNTIPDAVALLSPKDVMNIKKARIAPSSSTSLALTLSTGPVQHNTPDALITPPVTFYETYVRLAPHRIPYFERNL